MSSLDLNTGPKDHPLTIQLQIGQPEFEVLTVRHVIISKDEQLLLVLNSCCYIDYLQTC